MKSAFKYPGLVLGEMEAQIRGRTVEIIPVRDSHGRRVTQSENKIVGILKHLGCPPEGVSFSTERLAMKKSEAWVRFYSPYHRCHISYGAYNYAENMQALVHLLEVEAKMIASHEQTPEVFFERYREEGDEDLDRKEARETLGLPEDCKDWKLIDKTYKTLAKKAHPDMGGSEELFKRLNKAHKVLKKECE